MTDPAIGAPVRRKEDFRFLTGSGNYIDDINRPDQLYAYFVRSPHAHAEISARSTPARPRRAPGVIAVYTGDDMQEGRHAALRLGGQVQGRLADGTSRRIRCWRKARCAMSATRSPSSSPRPRRRRKTRPS